MEKQAGVVKFTLHEGYSLVMATDCLNEARNRSGTPYEERFREALRNAPDGKSREILDHIMDDFATFIGPARIDDDLTAIVLKKEGPNG